ncbi:MAG: polyhydroxyalkanoate depolymerase [Acetobacteraceae bacterium]|nr:polyhydroxyalkanoate depolymerase [Acetobacteraceae bacterium]
MFYHNYELQRLALTPMRILASNALSVLDLPHNPLRQTPLGRFTAAMLDSFEYTTRKYEKPEFGYKHTIIGGEPVPVSEEIVRSTTWCDLRRFRRQAHRPEDPRLLIVAPMSGHHATLLRGTAQAFLPDHDVHITDWRDAREVPVTSPDFDLDDYIDHIIAFFHALGENTHVLAVCQPAVPVLAAVALMSAAGDAYAPRSMTLIGGPVDTRVAPTAPNRFAQAHSLEWFRSNVIDRVPLGNPGFMREVYPGFLQLAGFMAMNFDRHVEAHWQMFLHLVQGDGESAAAKRSFYDEYRSTMDLPAEYYLQTIRAVFQEHLLPRGLMISRGRPIDLAAIELTALQTVEGERDDISGIGQTHAAHALCRRLPAHMKDHWEQPGVGHFGLFNGRRFQNEVAPRIKRFIQAHR